jgi:hypothetical protein
LERLGLDLLGAYRVAMRPRQVLTLVGAREWSGLAELAQATRTDPAVAAWDRYRAEVTEQAEEMVLLPARHGPLYRRPS